MALNAVIHTNERKIEAAKFFTGMFETALKKGELVEAVEFQIPEKSPFSFMIILLPVGLGDEPQV